MSLLVVKVFFIIEHMFGGGKWQNPFYYSLSIEKPPGSKIAEPDGLIRG